MNSSEIKRNLMKLLDGMDPDTLRDFYHRISRLVNPNHGPDSDTLRKVNADSDEEVKTGPGNPDEEYKKWILNLPPDALTGLA